MILKGHVYHPDYGWLREAVATLRLLQPAGRHAAAGHGTLGWHFEDRMRRWGWSYDPETFSIKGQLDFDTQGTIELNHTCPDAEQRHSLRQLWRHAFERATKWGRNDMKGAENGIDRKATGRAYNIERDFYRRGLMRSILTGSVMTPGRWRAARRLTEDEAKCRRCNLELDTVGHWWRCPAFERHRARHGLHDKDMDLDWLPACLSRCSLMPRACPGCDEKAKPIFTTATLNCLTDMFSDAADSPHHEWAHRLAKGRMKANTFVYDEADVLHFDEADPGSSSEEALNEDDDEQEHEDFESIYDRGHFGQAPAAISRGPAMCRF